MLVTCVKIIGVVFGDSVEITAAVVNALPVKIFAIFKKKTEVVYVFVNNDVTAKIRIKDGFINREPTLENSVARNHTARLRKRTQELAVRTRCWNEEKRVTIRVMV